MNKVITHLRNEHGWTQTELAGKLGWSQEDVSRLENGRTRLTEDKIKRLADVFGVKRAVILGDEEAIHKKPINKSLQPQIAGAMGIEFGPDTVPILGHANASSKAIMLNYDEPIGEAPRHPNQRGVKIAFYVRVYDESMAPRYYPGELAAINGNSMAISKQDCLIEMKNGEVYIKQFIKTTGKDVICEQLNPSKEWKRPLLEVKAIHAVVGRG